jgi:hypothetical protein
MGWDDDADIGNGSSGDSSSDNSHLLHDYWFEWDDDESSVVDHSFHGLYLSNEVGTSTLATG